MGDQEILQQFLPANVWAQVGNRVVKRKGKFDLQNFQNMSNSSPFFRDILYPNRAQALFEPAMGIVVPRLQELAKQKIIEKASKSEEELDSELQIKGREIVSSVILKSRSVCKLWNLAMDKIIHDLTNYKVMGEGWKERFRGLEKGGLYFVVEMCSVSSLMGHFEATHNSQAVVDRSPFVGKRAFVVLCCYGILDKTRDTRYPGEVMKVVKMYGKHLKSLRFHVVDNFSSADECYSKIRQLLVHTPNLTELDIKYDSVPARSKEDWEAVEVGKEENQLPHFPDLVQLDAKLPTPILKELVGKNKHVPKITIVET